MVIMSADTMTRVVLCDISEMFTHAFTKSSLGVTDVLFETNNAGYAVYDVVGFAVAIPNGIVFTPSYGTGDRA